MLIIKPPPPPFDDEQQRQQCTCLNAISYTKQITTSYSFPSHQCNNNMSEKQQQRDDVYVVIPQSEYSRLYNRQYAQLTDLRKSADPDGRSSTYLETTLKTHYPKVYLDMIRNDYILTAQERKNSHITDKDTPEERQGKSIQHSKQLDEVVSGKQKLNKLSKPYRPVAQCYVEQLTKSLPLAQRQVFRSYLRPYLDRIPFYLETKGNNDKSTMTTTKAGTTTATTKSLK